MTSRCIHSQVAVRPAVQQRAAQIVLRVVQAGALHCEAPVIVSALGSVVGTRTIQNRKVVPPDVRHDEIEFSGGIDEGSSRSDTSEFRGPLQIDEESVAQVAGAARWDLRSAATQRNHTRQPKRSLKELTPFEVGGMNIRL